jgi:hypothetical protein
LIADGKLQILLFLHGEKSIPISLSRAISLICLMQIKHMLLATLSRPEQYKCCKSHCTSFLIARISKMYEPENLKPFLFSLDEAFRMDKQVE